MLAYNHLAETIRRFAADLNFFKLLECFEVDLFTFFDVSLIGCFAVIALFCYFYTFISILGYCSIIYFYFYGEYLFKFSLRSYRY
jgi:hypothetical protein